MASAISTGQEETETMLPTDGVDAAGTPFGAGGTHRATSDGGDAAVTP
ncbi:MAG: hypothetical protein IKX30_09155 [Victivallales bacterium]|nr:hypothetical protein [Victivallales bacterium]